MGYSFVDFTAGKQIGEDEKTLLEDKVILSGKDSIGATYVSSRLAVVDNVSEKTIIKQCLVAQKDK